MKIRYPKHFRNGLLSYSLNEQDGENVLYTVRYGKDIIGFEINSWTPQIAFEIDGKLIKKKRSPDDLLAHPEEKLFRSYENALAKYKELSNSSVNPIDESKKDDDLPAI